MLRPRNHFAYILVNLEAASSSIFTSNQNNSEKAEKAAEADNDDRIMWSAYAGVSHKNHIILVDRRTPLTSPLKRLRTIQWTCERHDARLNVVVVVVSHIVQSDISNVVPFHVAQ